MNYCEFYLLGTCWQGKKRVEKCGDDRDKDRYKGILSKWILLAGYLLQQTSRPRPACNPPSGKTMDFDQRYAQ